MSLPRPATAQTSATSCSGQRRLSPDRQRRENRLVPGEPPPTSDRCPAKRQTGLHGWHSYEPDNGSPPQSPAAGPASHPVHRETRPSARPPAATAPENAGGKVQRFVP